MAGRDLTQGPIWRALGAVSAPMSFGILAVLSVGVVDAYFLGQLGGAPLAAIGFIYPVTAALTSLAIGLSAGANATISQSLGRTDNIETTARYAMHAFGLGLLLATLVASMVWLLHRPLFSIMGAGAPAMTEIEMYVPFWALSFPFLVGMMVVNAVFRAHGNGGVSAAIMVLAALINIVLDPVLIFGWGPFPALGTEGAALASFIGRVTAALLAVGYALRCGYLDVCINVMTDLARSVGELVRVGAPAAFSNAINPAGMALVTAAVATLGDTAVAGFGAATRVQSVAMVAMLALSAGIGPVVGQNWGGDKPERARAAVRLAWLFCCAYGALITVVLVGFAEPIAHAIASDPDAAEYTRQYFLFVSWSLFGYGILVTANAAMNARSKAVHSMVLSLSRIFVLYLPLAWIGVVFFGYEGVLVATVASNLITVFAALVAAQSVDLLASRRRLITVPARQLPTD